MFSIVIGNLILSVMAQAFGTTSRIAHRLFKAFPLKALEILLPSIVGSAVSFSSWALEVNSENFQDRESTDVLYSEEFLIVVALCLGCACPMVVDLLLDINEHGHINNLERFVLLCCLIVPSVVNLVMCRSKTMTLPIYYTMLCSTLVVMFSAITSILSKHGNYSQTIRIAQFASVAWVAVNIYYAFVFATHCTRCIPVVEALYAVVLVLAVAAFSHSGEEAFDFSLLIRISNYNTLSTDDLCWVIFSFTFFIFIAVSAISLTGVVHLHLLQHSLYEVARAACVIVLCTVPVRILRQREALSRREMAMKRAFVRYISHELRSPLNVISMSIDYLKTDIIRSMTEWRALHLPLEERGGGGGDACTHPSATRHPWVERDADGQTVPSAASPSSSSARSHHHCRDDHEHGQRGAPAAKTKTKTERKELQDVEKSLVHCSSDMERACDAARGVLTDLLMYDSFDAVSKKSELHMSMINAKEMLKEIVESIHGAIEMCRGCVVALSDALLEDDVNVYVDRNALERVLKGLLTNILHHRMSDVEASLHDADQHAFSNRMHVLTQEPLVHVSAVHRSQCCIVSNAHIGVSGGSNRSGSLLLVISSRPINTERVQLLRSSTGLPASAQTPRMLEHRHASRIIPLMLSRAMGKTDSDLDGASVSESDVSYGRSGARGCSPSSEGRHSIDFFQLEGGLVSGLNLLLCERVVSDHGGRTFHGRVAPDTLEIVLPAYTAPPTARQDSLLRLVHQPTDNNGGLTKYLQSGDKSRRYAPAQQTSDSDADARPAAAAAAVASATAGHTHDDGDDDSGSGGGDRGHAHPHARAEVHPTADDASETKDSCGCFSEAQREQHISSSVPMTTVAPPASHHDHEPISPRGVHADTSTAASVPAGAGAGAGKAVAYHDDSVTVQHNAAGHISARGQWTQEKQEQQQQQQQRVLHFLVVDDSAMNRKVICRLLTSMGHTCVEAIDGVPAVEALALALALNGSGAGNNNSSCITSSSSSSTAIDAVLMDNIMVNMNGPEAAQRMRVLGYRGPIIGVTGNALPSDVEDFKSKGADEVIFKPLKRDLFESLLVKYFGANVKL